MSMTRLKAFLGRPAAARAAEWLQPLLLAALTVLAAYRFAALGVDTHHDGIILKPALDIAAGKMIFRDTFSQYGAAAPLLQGLALKLFGPRLLVLRLQTVFLYSLTIIVLWKVWRRFLPGWLATLCGLVYIFMAPYFLNHFYMPAPNFGWWLMPWPSVFALFFLSLALYFALLALEDDSPVCAGLAGIAAALALWSRQPVGLLLFPALACGFSLPAGPGGLRAALRRRLAPFLSGFAALNALVLAWLFLNGALQDMWLQCFVYPLAWAGETGGGTMAGALFPVNLSTWSFPSPVWLTLPVVCLLFFISEAVRLVRGRSSGGPALITALAVCLASWAQYYPIPCERHVYWAAAPLIGFFALSVLKLSENWRTGYGKPAAALALCLLFTPDMLHRLGEARIKLGREYVELQSPAVLAGMKVPPHDALLLNGIRAELNGYFVRRPDGGIVNTTGDALFTVLAGTAPAAHKLSVYWPALIKLYPDYWPAVGAYVHARRPVVFSQFAPAEIKGYELRTRWRSIYVMEPAETGRGWSVTRLDPEGLSLDKRLDTVYDLTLDIKAEGERRAVVSGLRVLAFDPAGRALGGWLPAPGGGACRTLVYRAGTLTGQKNGSTISLEPGKKTCLRLTGHDFPYFYSALHLRIEAAKGGAQDISIQPLLEPEPGMKVPGSR